MEENKKEEPAILGIPISSIKCRLCDNPAVQWRTGNYEIKDDYVTSVRMYFLCNDHINDEAYDRHDIDKLQYDYHQILRDIHDGKIKEKTA